MPQDNTTEREYLDRQAADAKAAMGRVWSNIKSEAAHGADPRLWTQNYPWAATASAIVGGFVAAYALIPSKEQQALKRLAELHRRLSPPPPPTMDGRSAAKQQAQPSKKSEAESIFSSIGRQLLHGLQPMLMSTLTAGITGKMMQPQQSQEQEQPQQEQQPSSSHDNPYVNAAQI